MFYLKKEMLRLVSLRLTNQRAFGQLCPIAAEKCKLILYEWVFIHGKKNVGKPKLGKRVNIYL